MQRDLVQPKPDARRLTRRALLQRSLIALASAAAIDAVILEPRTIRFERREVPIFGLPGVFDGYRIAFLADLHFPTWIKGAFIRRAIRAANEFHPDLIAFGGDLFDLKGALVAPNVSGIYEEAHAPDGVVGVLGNHDHGLDIAAVHREIARSTPVRLIENTSFLVERKGKSLAIGGVGDLWHGVVDPQSAFAGVPPNVPRIMLSHNPDVAEEMQEGIRVDLQLSGHTHGGQVHIPYGPSLHVPSRYGNKFAQGLVQGKRHRVYVTRGLCSMRWVRFCCPPEVTGIILRAM